MINYLTNTAYFYWMLENNPNKREIYILMLDVVEVYADTLITHVSLTAKWKCGGQMVSHIWF